MKLYKHFSTITGLFTACLVISNILDTKLFQLGTFTFPAGIILFPIVYVFGDIFTEVYGYAQSRKAIWTGLISLLLLTGFTSIAQFLPAASFWSNQDSFEIILGKVPRIVIASLTAFFLGEFANSLTIAKLKIKQGGKSVQLRFIASTVIGQFVDTLVFIIIAFGGTISLNDTISTFLSAWLFKIIWEIVALPISVPLVTWLKKVENEDYFDTNTNFNPFKVS